MLPMPAGHVANHVANHVAKPGSYVANYLAKLVILTVSWQHPSAVLNTERAFPAVFRLSLSEFGRNLVTLCQRGLLNPLLGRSSAVRETRYLVTAHPTSRHEDERSLWFVVLHPDGSIRAPTAVLWAHSMP